MRLAYDHLGNFPGPQHRLPDRLRQWLSPAGGTYETKIEVTARFSTKSGEPRAGRDRNVL